MAGFGEVQYENEQPGKPGDTPAGGKPNGAAAAQEIDENDPRLVSEDLTVNTEANAYAMPSPPPEGMRFRAKLKLVPVKVKDAAGVEHEKNWIPREHDTKGLYAKATVEATILDPSGKYDGIKVYEYQATTLLNRDGGHKVQTLLSVLRQPDGKPWFVKDARMPHKAWMDLFAKALSGEPEIGFEPRWEWSCEDCGKKAKASGGDYPRSVVGMRKFPPDLKNPGKHLAEMKCELVPAHGWSRAQVRIGEVFRASEVKG